jgi:hypothetical protein
VTELQLKDAKDQDLIKSLAAIKRAAILARTHAVQTNTAIVILRGEKIVRLTADDIRQEQRNELPST